MDSGQQERDPRSMAQQPGAVSATQSAQCSQVDAGSAVGTAEPAAEERDYDVLRDPEFLQSVLENLPGVDPNSEAIRKAVGSLASQAAQEKKDKKRKDEE